MSRKRFEILAAKYGIEFDHLPGGKARGPFAADTVHKWDIMIGAPAGMVFKATGLHLDGSIQGNDREAKTDWGRATRELQALIDGGIIACPDGSECEHCHPED